MKKVALILVAAVSLLAMTSCGAHGTCEAYHKHTVSKEEKSSKKKKFFRTKKKAVQPEEVVYLPKFAK